jgi:hypothetical protein
MEISKMEKGKVLKEKRYYAVFPNNPTSNHTREHGSLYNLQR